MSLMTSRPAMAARKLVRTVGLAHLLGSLANRRGYEAQYHEALINLVRKGDTIWDIGANVGVYTKLFAELAGPEGKVVAFEPSARNGERLSKAVDGFGNVQIVAAALGSSDTEVEFAEGSDESGSNARIDESCRKPPTDETSRVRMVRAETLLVEGAVPSPCVIKLDVEGYEIEVLEGMGQALASPQLRSVCVEVHSAQLDERGIKDGGRRIERLLERNGFRPRWVDFSHIVAVRKV